MDASIGQHHMCPAWIEDVKLHQFVRFPMTWYYSIFIDRSYPDNLIIPWADVLNSPMRKCNTYGSTIFIPWDSVLMNSVYMHAGYLFCN